MSLIKLKIDVRTGTLEIETDNDSFATVTEKASELLDKFLRIDLSSKDFPPIAAQASQDQIHRQSEDITTPDPKIEADVKNKKKRSPGNSKVANWQIVENLLDENGRTKLKEFFEQKRPATQNEQVAVLAVKLKEITGNEGFDGNEIYTAFQVVGKKTPKNLNAVFGNMAASGLGSQVDKKFRPNFKAGDMVKLELPKKGEKS